MENNTITKEAFINIINAVLEFEQLQLGFAKDMDKYLDGHFVTDFGGKLSATILDSLERCFAFGQPDDKFSGGIISWWLWDAPNAGKSLDSACIGSNRIDGMWYSLATPELLYEYLTTGQTSALTIYQPKQVTIPAGWGK
jgi:hypothetical protein